MARNDTRDKHEVARDEKGPIKSAEIGDPKRGPDGKFGPGNIANPAGRPKRKTLTELIHEKLDTTDGAWDAIVTMAINKILKDGDKEVLRTLWNYTDGMPNQKMEHSGDIKVVITDYGTEDIPTTETETGTEDSGK